MSYKQFFKEGLSANLPDDIFDPEQLRRGIQVEYEHTNDREMAKKIAKDHLVEFPDYYDRLEKMEQEAEKYWTDNLYNRTKVGRYLSKTK
jgi:hypothetical protein